jgi:ribonuclease P protein component
MEKPCARLPETEKHKVGAGRDQEASQEGEEAACGIAWIPPESAPWGHMSRTYSLGKRQLVRGSRNFRRIISKGKKHVGACSVLYVVSGQPATRIGIVAGKRIGGAVERNRAKRLLREAMRLNRAMIADGFEIVLIARKAAVHNTLQCIELDTTRLLERAGCARIVGERS